MPTLLRSKSAISIFEVIVAVFIISVTSVALLTLLMAALQGTRISRDKMIAINLSYEGIDIVRNAVETNWLIYSVRREECWNNRPDETSCSDPSPEIIATGNYTAGINSADYSLELSAPITTGSLDLRNGVDPNDERYRLFKNPATGLYVHDNTGNKSVFFRQIYIEYPTTNIMEIRSLVQWQDEKQVQDVEIVDRISNYQK